MLTRSARLGRKVGLYLRLRHPSSKVHEISKKIKRIVFLETMKDFVTRAIIWRLDGRTPHAAGGWQDVGAASLGNMGDLRRQGLHQSLEIQRT